MAASISGVQFGALAAARKVVGAKLVNAVVQKLDATQAKALVEARQAAVVVASVTAASATSKTLQTSAMKKTAVAAVDAKQLTTKVLEAVQKRLLSMVNSENAEAVNGGNTLDQSVRQQLATTAKSHSQLKKLALTAVSALSQNTVGRLVIGAVQEVIESAKAGEEAANNPRIILEEVKALGAAKDITLKSLIDQELKAALKRDLESAKRGFGAHSVNTVKWMQEQLHKAAGNADKFHRFGEEQAVMANDPHLALAQFSRAVAGAVVDRVTEKASANETPIASAPVANRRNVVLGETVVAREVKRAADSQQAFDSYAYTLSDVKKSPTVAGTQFRNIVRANMAEAVGVDSAATQQVMNKIDAWLKGGKGGVTSYAAYGLANAELRKLTGAQGSAAVRDAVKKIAVDM